MASPLRRLEEDQVPDKVKRNKEIVGEAMETDTGGVGKGVVDEVVTDKTAKQ